MRPPADRPMHGGGRATGMTVGRRRERVTRIELALSAWEADVLPLNYTRGGLAAVRQRSKYRAGGRPAGSSTSARRSRAVAENPPPPPSPGGRGLDGRSTPGRIAAFHSDARTAQETDWVQVVEWCDELVRLSGSPVARLDRGRRGRRGRRFPGGPGRPRRARPRPAPRPRRRGPPARAGRGPGHRGTALRRGRPGGTEPGRTRPPHPAGRPARRGTTRLSATDAVSPRAGNCGWSPWSPPGRARP
jgi:hypothetical protein